METCGTDELLEFGIRYLVGQIPHEQLLRHEILRWEAVSENRLRLFWYALPYLPFNPWTRADFRSSGSLFREGTKRLVLGSNIPLIFATRS